MESGEDREQRGWRAAMTERAARMESGEDGERRGRGEDG